MTKEKKRRGWTAFVRGVGVSLLLYLAGVALLAFLVVKGGLPEYGTLPALAALGAATSAAGGKVAAGQISLPPVSAALLNAVLFVLILALAGGVGWPEVMRSSRSVICGGSVLVGGLTAGLLGGGKKRRRKRRVMRG